MKRAFKIAGIVLGVLAALVVVASLIVVNTVASSERLTRILKQHVPQYVNCQMELGKASVTLFKTFPNLGVGIEHVALVNPMKGSPSDTLASIDEITVTLDLKQLLREKKVMIRQCVLENALVNIYTDPKGNSNLNVFQVKENTDTTVFSFDYLVDMEEIRLKNATLFFTDGPGHFSMRVKGVDMGLNGKFQDDDIRAGLKMKVGDFYLLNYATTFGIKNVSLAFTGGLKQFELLEGVLTATKPDLQLKPSQKEAVHVTMPFEFNLKDLKGRFWDAKASLEDFLLFVKGNATVAKDGNLVFGFDVVSNDMSLDGLLSYLPLDLNSLTGPYDPKDKLKLTIPRGKVEVNPTKAPHIRLKIQANDLSAVVSGQEPPLLKGSAGVLLGMDLRKANNNIEKADIEVKDCALHWRESNLNLKGKAVDNKADFQVNIDLLDVKQIVDLINGLNLPKEPKPKEESHPFMVPPGMDLTVGLHTKKTVYEDIDFNDLAGTVTMKDTTLVLQDIKCSNKSARMELSALYKSAREDNLFFALDFRLADVQVHDFLHMIPYFDTLVPMLKTFDGQCDLGIDASTNLGADYLPKLPTLRGEATVKGKNLTVKDEFTFTKITDLLGVSTGGEFRVDNLDVQLFAQNSRIDLWPSQVAVGKYGAVVEGFMTPDKNVEYHISLTESPFRMRHAVKVWGPLDKLKFDLEPSKYPNHYTPLERSEHKQFHKDLRKMLAERVKSRLQKTE